MKTVLRIALAVGFIGFMGTGVWAQAPSVSGNVITNNSTTQSLTFSATFAGNWTAWDTNNNPHSGSLGGSSASIIGASATYDCSNDITLAAAASIAARGITPINTVITGVTVTISSYSLGGLSVSMVWNSQPPSDLEAGVTYNNQPQATGMSSSGTLSAMSIDICVNGSWSAWAYAGGGNGSVSNNYGNAFTPAAGNQYQFRAWATDNSGSTSYAYTPIYTLPSISWTVSPPTLYGGNSYPQIPQARGESVAGDLTTVSIDVSVNGGAWSPWAYAGGGNGSTSDNNGNTLNPITGWTYQFRVRATTNSGASSGYIYSAVYTAN